MTDDLHATNRRLAEHCLGRLSSEQDDYLRHASVCFAQLPYSPKTLTRFIERLRRTHPHGPKIADLNRQYLRFARLAAKDALSNRPDVLIRLGVSIEQAIFLRDLSDDDIDHLVLGWKRLIVRFPVSAFRRGARLQQRVSRLHAESFVAARPDNDAGEPA